MDEDITLNPENPSNGMLLHVAIPSARLLVQTVVQNSTLMPTSASRAADISSTMSAVSVVPD